MAALLVVLVLAFLWALGTVMGIQGGDFTGMAKVFVIGMGILIPVFGGGYFVVKKILA